MQGAVELIIPSRSSEFQSLPDEDRPGSPELRSKWRSEGAAEMARAVERLMFMRGSRGESGPLVAAYTETSGGDALLVSGWLRFREPQTLERYLATDIYRDDLMLTLVSWACAVGVRLGVLLYRRFAGDLEELHGAKEAILVLILLSLLHRSLARSPAQKKLSMAHTDAWMMFSMFWTAAVPVPGRHSYFPWTAVVITNQFLSPRYPMQKNILATLSAVLHVVVGSGRHDIEAGAVTSWLVLLVCVWAHRSAEFKKRMTFALHQEVLAMSQAATDACAPKVVPHKPMRATAAV